VIGDKREQHKFISAPTAIAATTTNTNNSRTNDNINNSNSNSSSNNFNNNNNNNNNNKTLTTVRTTTNAQRTKKIAAANHGFLDIAFIAAVASTSNTQHRQQ